MKCIFCGREYEFHETGCPYCSHKKFPMNSAQCQLCGRKTTLPLIKVVKGHSKPGPWGLRAVGLMDIKGNNLPKLGSWVCYRCACPDMVFPEDHGEGRVCVSCGGPVSRYNPNPWCFSCHKNRRFNRICEICGKRLSNIEHERCSSCDEANPWPSGTTYYAPLSTRKILSSSKPLKPGPGGLKSKNRIGLTIIQVKEALRSELRKRIKKLAKMRRPIRIAEENAKFLRSHGEHVEANIFEEEAAKLKESNQETIEKLESEISSIMDAISAVNEVAHEQVHIPSSVRKGKTVVTWVPIAPFTQDEIEELIRSLREN